MRNLSCSGLSKIVLRCAYSAFSVGVFGSLFMIKDAAAGDDSSGKIPQHPLTLSTEPPVPAVSTADPRYGLLDLLDSRSQYGKGVFPEPFIVDDSDLEVNEIRLDWFHSEARGSVGNRFTAEFEKCFGLLTVEVAAHYDYDSTDGERVQGFGNFDVGARYPFYQYVSANEFVDSTFGIGIEVGIPTNSPLSKNTEIVPKIFDDVRLGDHFSLQCLLGYSFLRGSGAEGGNQAFEYGFVFGWTIQHNELPLPTVNQIIPVFEMKGETLLNTQAGRTNSLLGNVALRFNMQAIGRFQPRLGIGYVFPLDQGAREGTRWGVYTSVIFDY